VKSENRAQSARNVAGFLHNYDIQGVDFDREYPGATEIPGVPSGGVQEAQNCLESLVLPIDLLAETKLILVALPASFWYLKAFPVEKLAETGHRSVKINIRSYANGISTVDYFIYMTVRKTFHSLRVQTG
jgi:GH18 family chitinase